jgi:hypothetical protein
MAAWLRSLPIRSLLRSPALFDLGLHALAKTPPSLTRRVAGINRRQGARAQIGRATSTHAPRIPALYFSSRMPGPFLDLPPAPAHGLGSDRERARELRDWCQVWSAPRMPIVPRAEQTRRDWQLGR